MSLTHILQSTWTPSPSEQARLALREARLKQERIEMRKMREREERNRWTQEDRLTMV